MQSFIVINCFYGDRVDRIFKSIESIFPFANGKLIQMLEKQRESLNSTVVKENDSPLAKIWDIVLALMIGYFIVSFVHSTVNDYKRSRLLQKKNN